MEENGKSNYYTKSMEFYIKRTAIELTDKEKKLIDDAYNELDRKEFLAFNPEIDGKDLLKMDGYLYRVIESDSKDLASIIYLAFPHKENEIAKELNIDEMELGQLKVAIVKNEYRGHGLMKRLIAEAEKDAIKKNIGYLFATVHPENYPSRLSLEHAGYHKALEKKMYGGLTRLIMLKKIFL